MEDVFGAALLDYQNGGYTEDIITYSSLDETDSMPLPHLFRDYANMPFLEQNALDLSRGSILDIGCGAGSHSLYLQQQGYEVTALDTSAGAIETCRMRGIQDTVHGPILGHIGAYDTLLLLMNGIGIAGRMHHLPHFLNHLKSLLAPGGQILLDSSDIIYMFKEDSGEISLPPHGHYYGEVSFTLQYKGQKSRSFYWLYLDFDTLKRASQELGLGCKLVSQGNHYDYLAELWVI